jgi:hypothetical protein
MIKIGAGTKKYPHFIWVNRPRIRRDTNEAKSAPVTLTNSAKPENLTIPS